MTTTAERKTIVLSDPSLESMGELVLEIQGTSPLIMNQFSNKMRDEILKKQMGKANPGKSKKNPEDCMLDALHVIGKRPKSIDDLDETDYGFPAVAFKSAAVRMAKLCGTPMTDSRLMFFIQPDDGELVRIKSDPPEMRTDTVRIQNTCDIRIRPMFKKWAATLRILFNTRQVSAEQLYQWFRDAGRMNGVGEMRPGGRQSSHVFGCWKVTKAEASVPNLKKES